MLSGKGLPINARRPSVICVAFTLLVTTVGVAGYTAGITAFDTAAETASIDTSTEPRLESEVARLRNELRTATLQKEEAEWRARSFIGSTANTFMKDPLPPFTATRFQFEQRLEGCTRDIPGWFEGQAVYRAAVHDLSRLFNGRDNARTGKPMVFVEIGAYLGQSTCYLSWLLQGTGAAIDVIDQWGAVLRPMDTPWDSQSFQLWLNKSAPGTAYNETLRENAFILKDDMLRHIIDDSKRVMVRRSTPNRRHAWPHQSVRSPLQAVGKGQFMLSFAHSVQTSGYWPAVRSVLHGNAKDSANGPVIRYSNNSIAFVYVDRCRRGRVREMMLWWPKVRPGGRMCGDDMGAKGVRPRLNNFFYRMLPRELSKHKEPTGRATWEVVKGAHDHWCATKPQ
jgi:hypothetical protein